MDAVMISHTSSAQQASQLQFRTATESSYNFFGQFVTNSEGTTLQLQGTATPIPDIREFMSRKFGLTGGESAVEDAAVEVCL